MESLILLEKYFLLFMIYSIAGWCVEEVVCSIGEKKIVDRGFLIGPVCPIYGFGGIAITIFLTKFIESPITVFCMAVFVSAILEYFTSYIMEKIFNARWWDYSNDKLNLNGRICIRNLIPFGLFGLLLIYFVNPGIWEWINFIPKTPLQIISISLFIILLLDFIISMSVVSEVTKKAKVISSENPKDNTDEITAKVKEELKESFAGNRLVNAYPDFTAFRSKIKEIAIDTAQKGKEAVINTAEKSKEVVKTTAEKGKKVVKETAQKGKKVVEQGKKKVESTADKGKKAMQEKLNKASLKKQNKKA